MSKPAEFAYVRSWRVLNSCGAAPIVSPTYSLARRSTSRVTRLASRGSESGAVNEMAATEDRAVKARAESRKILVAAGDSPFSVACSTAAVAIVGRDDEQHSDEAVRGGMTSCTCREWSFDEPPGCVGLSVGRGVVQPTGHAP